MLNLVRRIAALILCVGAASVQADPLPSYSPLDQPALPSVLAATGALLDIRQVGERLVAVGERGHIVYSEDGGQQWQQAQVPVSVTLTAVDFVDDQHGWAVGHGLVILATADGGLTWQRQTDGRQLVGMWHQQAEAAQQAGDDRLAMKLQRYSDDGADKPLLDVHFINAQDGLAVGAYGVMLSTDNGGQSWHSAAGRLGGEEDRHIYHIASDGDGIILMGEMGLLYQSGDRGQHFQPLDSPSDASLFSGWYSASQQQLLLLGLRGTLWHGDLTSADWQPLAIDTQYSLLAILPLTTGGYLLSDDGGGLWRLQANGTTSRLSVHAGFPLLALSAGTRKAAPVMAVGLQGTLAVTPAAQP